MKKLIAAAFAMSLATFAHAQVETKLFDAKPVTCTNNPAATPATGCDYSYPSDYSAIYAQTSVALYCWEGASVTVSGREGGGLVVDNVLNVNDQSVTGFAGWSYPTAWNDPASLGADAYAAYNTIAPVTVLPVAAYGWNFLQLDLVDEGGVYANTELWLNATNCTLAPKLTLCHKGKTITISNDAVKAHIDHGDSVASLNVGCP